MENEKNNQPEGTKKEAPTLESLAKENETIKSMLEDLKTLVKANAEAKKFEAPKQPEAKVNDWEGIE